MKGSKTLMKNLKKLSGILLAIAVLLACTVSAFAAPSGTNGNVEGTIKINSPKADQTYTVYQVLVLESFDTSKPSYSYTVATGWDGFLTGDGATYLQEDSNGYVTWIGERNDTAYAAFAKKALKYAQDNRITGTSRVASDGNLESDGSLLFSSLHLGYYVVDSTVGALCSLTTTNSDGEVNEKNDLPTVTKKVEEDGVYGTGESSAQIGDTVNFETTITVKKGAENFVLHDEMSAGLTLNASSIKVYKTSVADSNAVDPSNFTISTTGLLDSCDFEISFVQDYLDGISNALPDLSSSEQIIVRYSATLNENAVISGDGTNDNTTHLSFGTNQNTAPSTTTTTTYKFDLVKTDAAGKLLNGAVFKLYDVLTSGDPIKVVPISGGYRVANGAEAGATAEISVTNGKVVILGLDDVQYYVEEVTAPDGYNKITGRSAENSIEISRNNLAMVDGDNNYQSGGLRVINKTGALLPSTGGIGTTIFYIVGGVLVAAAVVLLVAKKRTSENR